MRNTRTATPTKTESTAGVRAISELSLAACVNSQSQDVVAGSNPSATFRDQAEMTYALYHGQGGFNAFATASSPGVDFYVFNSPAIAVQQADKLLEANTAATNQDAQANATGGHGPTNNDWPVTVYGNVVLNGYASPKAPVARAGASSTPNAEDYTVAHCLGTTVGALPLPSTPPVNAQSENQDAQHRLTDDAVGALQSVVDPSSLNCPGAITCAKFLVLSPAQLAQKLSEAPLGGKLRTVASPTPPAGAIGVCTISPETIKLVTRSRSGQLFTLAVRAPEAKTGEQITGSTTQEFPLSAAVPGGC